MTTMPVPSRDERLAPPDTEPRVARAVYGLVDDQYGVVAHSPNLTREAALALCRAAGIGDPTTPIDDAVSFLEVPEWGVICTRYATRLDGRGRLALVSDSVAVDAASFRALRADPFRCVPRRGELDAAAGPRALDVPRFTPSTPAAEGARLTDARAAVDEARELRPLLAALLAGERVLWISPNDPPSAAALQCLVLLLPPSLRRLMTFQTAATRAPFHAPRLTAADRRYAELATVAWTRELPREMGTTHPRADAAADELLGLAPDALAAAHALYERLAADGAPVAADALLDAVERMLRAGAFESALRRGHALDALRAACAHPQDAASLVALALDALPAAALGDAVAGLLAEGTPNAFAAGALALGELLRVEAESKGGEPIATHALDAALAGTERVRWTTDAPARQARAALALLAARRGDADRLVSLAEIDAPWWEHEPAPRGAPTAVRLTSTVVAALSHARAGDADAAVAALDAIAALPLGTAARRDAAALGHACAARAVATVAAHVEDRGASARLRRLAGAAQSFWDRLPPAAARADAIRRLLAGDRVDARELEPLGTDERAGWAAAAALGALAGGTSVAPLAAALRAEPNTARALGAVLREEAADGPALGDGWPALLALVDADVRRELLGRALHRATRGDLSLGALAAACDALAALDYRLDGDAATRVGAATARWGASLPPTRASAARLGGALALLGELADADANDALRAAVLRDVPEPLRALVQLRRLAAATADVEATREPGTWDALRAAVRSEPDTLLPKQLAALRAFFGVRRKK